MGTSPSGGSKLTTPLHPDDYLRLRQPALELARAARPGREGGPGDRGRSDAGDPARGGAGATTTARASTSASACRSTGKCQWRSYSVSSPPRAQQCGRSRSRCARCPRGSCPPTWCKGLEPGTIVRLALPEGEFVLPDPPPDADAVPGGRQRRHAGDGDAAHPRPTLPQRRQAMPDVVMHYSSPTRGADDLPRASSSELAERHDVADPARAAHRHRRDARARGPRRPVRGLARARDLGLRPGADARRDRGALREGRARGPAAHRAVLPRPGRRRRRGRHHHVPELRQDHRGRRRHHRARGGRGGRHRHALRLPHGHLPHLHDHQGRRHHARPAQRRRVRPAQRAGADLHHAPPSATAPSTSDADRRRRPMAISDVKEYTHLSEEDVEQLGRELDAHPRRDRGVAQRGRRGVHQPDDQGPARPGLRRAGDAVREPQEAGVRRGRDACSGSPRSSRTWRSATTSCTASGTG